MRGGGVVIFESIGTRRIYGGSHVSIRACSVFTVVDGKFTDQRIYVAKPRFCARMTWTKTSVAANFHHEGSPGATRYRA
jgi:hypothetical protein